ncbi:MAG: Helix-turn-helix domain protein [Verrucomicrobia bacterium ADurb.Bin122]|nr:MAG: Helix-turn-helix domain protein [Verrucomicrobia bacterium ADurb.Bin122]HQL22549.1 helix-turn-helix domain-containing protein [Opitutaceae bacterium]
MSTTKSPTIRGMDTLALIASRLRELRLRHGLTQQEFAELAGVGFKFYQLLESGRKKQIWLETVERLAAPYGLAVWQFLAPELPADTHIKSKVVKSMVHYERRKGPYNKSSRRTART